MIAALQGEIELFATHSFGQARRIGSRSQRVLYRFARKLQGTRIVDRSVFQKESERESDGKLSLMHTVADDQSIQLAVYKGPARPNRLIFQTKGVSSLSSGSYTGF